MQASNERRSPLLDTRYVAVLVAAMACFGLFQATSIPTNADVAWYLYAGAQILDGAQLGRDIVEVNTPLVIAISTGVEALARTVGISAIAVLPWLVTALACGSIALSAYLARDWPHNYRLAFVLALAYVLMVHIGGMFAQREHLLLILVMPYVCSVVEIANRRSMATLLAIATGIVAVIGFTLKPFFIPAWFGLEAYLAWRIGVRTLWRPQALAMLATLLLVAIAVAIWTPDYLPFALESLALYRAYQPYGELPLFLSQSLLFVVLAMVVAWRSARASIAQVVDVCCVLAATLSIAVFLQGKGWHYQWFTAVAFGMILLALAAAALTLRRRTASRAGVQGIVALTILLLALRTYFFWTIDKPERRELEALIRTHAAGDSILALSSHLNVGFPLVNETGVRWASRYPTMWQICGLYRPTRSANDRAVEPAERKFFDNVYRDLATSKPGVLLVDTVPPAPAWTEFDYLSFFRRDPRLDEMFKEYRMLQQVGRYRVYWRSETSRSHALRGNAKQRRFASCNTSTGKPRTSGVIRAAERHGDVPTRSVGTRTFADSLKISH